MKKTLLLLSFLAMMIGCTSTEKEADNPVLTIEGASHKIAETVIRTTGKKNQKILALDSMQSVTAAEIQAGASYLSIMEENLEVLREALN